MVEDEPDSATMQNIAMEIGFSETAFLQKVSDGKYRIRFFTPKMEIPLCGHATLASSKIIFLTTALEKICLLNIEGVELKIEKRGDQIVLAFPVYQTEAMDVPIALLNALGIKRVVDTRFNCEMKQILIVIEDAPALAALQPDFHALVNSYSGINGVLVTAPSHTDGFDSHYRYFWPWSGTDEDPVTGAVQTFLTKYWADKLEKNKLRAFQSSQRTRIMTTELADGKVFIFGEAVTVFEGTFYTEAHAVVGQINKVIKF